MSPYGSPSGASLFVGCGFYASLLTILYRDAKSAGSQADPAPHHAGSVPPCSLQARGSSTQIFQAKKKGLKNPGPCEDPLPSAARGGHARGMVGTEGWSQ